MDMQAKRRVVEKLLKQTLEKLGIEAEILPYNEFHGDEYMFEINIIVDSSKYHKAGPNYVKGYNDHIDYIEDELTAKLKSYGLDDFYGYPKYTLKNFEWAKEKVLNVLKDLFHRWDISEERLLKSFSIGKGRCKNLGSVRPYLVICVENPLNASVNSTKLGQILALNPDLEDFYVKY